MTKQRFAPPVLHGHQEKKKSAIVFANERSDQTQQQDRYQRFFPGVESAANQPPQDPRAQVDTPKLTEPGQDAVPEDTQAQDLQAELEQAFEKAAHEGFAAGLAQAQEQTQAQIDAHMKQMQDMLQVILDLRRSVFEEYQEQCLELALAGAEALARASLQQDRQALRQLIGDAITELSGQDSVILQVNPENAAELETWVKERFASQSVQVIADPDMQDEDFRAMTKTGSVTGDFQERLAKLRQMVFQHRGRVDEDNAA